jgi:hypothetical protein
VSINFKRDTLQQLGRRYKTDKGSHNFKGITYLHIYDIFFRWFRDVPMNILELGVKRGASLRVWRDYFRKGQVYGLDVNPSCKKWKDKRIHIVTGYQDDEKLLSDLAKKTKGFDIVLDDCSHINVLTLESFKILWPYVKPGGLYVVEDLRNSYTVNLEADMKKGGWLSPHQKKSTKLENHRIDMNELFFELIRQLDYRTGDKYAIHFYPMVCIMEKVK